MKILIVFGSVLEYIVILVLFMLFSRWAQTRIWAAFRSVFGRSK